MKLSKVERWLLSQQLMILEYVAEAAGDKEGLEGATLAREAIESGWEAEYDQYTSYLDGGLSEEGCREVVQVLDMYRALTFGYDELKDKAGIEQSDVTFIGFDGNNETPQMAYARYVCERKGLFTEHEAARKVGFNSHYPVLDSYRRMLSKWREFGESHDLTSDQIKAIVEARAYPK